jgi:glyoxalase family protein
MTFFDWPNAGQDIRGMDSITGTAFRVSSKAALEFWSRRFKETGTKQGEITEFAGRQLLPFEDPEGQRLYLANDQGAKFKGEIWQRPDIPDEYTLRGFYSVILSIPSIDQLEMIFKDVLNYQEKERTQWIDQRSKAVIYATVEDGGPGSEVWVLEQPQEGRARLGAGGTHHVAFRVKDLETQETWRSQISQAGLHVTKVIDRFWFTSIYFRVSNGILFEIATDGPGFAIDETPDNLGEKLVLPPFLENRRKEIEAGLIPIGA